MNLKSSLKKHLHYLCNLDLEKSINLQTSGYNLLTLDNSITCLVWTNWKIANDKGPEKQGPIHRD